MRKIQTPFSLSWKLKIFSLTNKVASPQQFWTLFKTEELSVVLSTKHNVCGNF